MCCCGKAVYIEQLEHCVAFEDPLFDEDDTSLDSHIVEFGAVEKSCLLSEDSLDKEVEVKIKRNTLFANISFVIYSSVKSRFVIFNLLMRLF